jgi:hypothetical protein
MIKTTRVTGIITDKIYAAAIQQTIKHIHPKVATIARTKRASIVTQGIFSGF